MDYGKRFARCALLAIGLLGAFGRLADRQARAIELPAMGINPVGYSYYGTALPFVDVAHMSGRWIMQRPIPLNDTGYPASLPAGEVARSPIYTHNGGIYPTGVYTLRWEGSGSVQLSGQGVSVVSSKPQEIRYNVANRNSNGLLVDITATDPANPVKNISVRAPFAELATGRETFNPLYKKNISNYGVLRMMGWNATNNSPISKWSERTTPGDFHWGGELTGVPYEYQIQLSNELNEDLWLNVPHLADDDYVRNLAGLVRQRLSPNLRVWVEYSNEVWNPAFQQFRYALDVLRPKYGVSNPAQAYGRRSAEIFDIFSNQLTNPNRLVRVLGGQAANSWVLNQSIIGATVGGKLKADVATVADYFYLNPDNLYQQHLQGTVDLNRVFADMRTNIESVTAKISENQKLAAAHGLPLVAYEGGQHLIARPGQQHNDQTFVDLLNQINRDERMGPLYTYMLDQWYQAGGKTFVFAGDTYRSDKWGAWGLQESYLDTNAVKYRAVQQYLQRLKTNPADFNKDGNFDYRDYDIWRHTYGSTVLWADANGDRMVDGADFVLYRHAKAVNAKLSTGLVLALVPEPNTLLLAFGTLSISLVDVRRLLRRS